MKERELNPNLDPTDDNLRGPGVVPPEKGPQEQDVVGRPVTPGQAEAAFHEPTETDGVEREKFSPREAEAEGGSFDAMGNVPPRPPTER